MNDGQFAGLLHNRINAIRYTLNAKAGEYAHGDRLYNFKRSAEILRSTPQEALWGMFVKHLVSVIDLVEGRLLPDEDLINKKIGDAINYLILLEAILKEPMIVEIETESAADE